QSRRCVGRPAADACGRRKMLVEFEGARGELRDALAEPARDLEDQVVVEVAAFGGPRTRYFQGQPIARQQADCVITIGKCNEALELMVAVGAPTLDVQRQVDLCARTLG